MLLALLLLFEILLVLSMANFLHHSEFIFKCARALRKSLRMVSVADGGGITNFVCWFDGTLRCFERVLFSIFLPSM